MILFLDGEVRNKIVVRGLLSVYHALLLTINRPHFDVILVVFVFFCLFVFVVVLEKREVVLGS